MYECFELCVKKCDYMFVQMLNFYSERNSSDIFVT